MVYVTQEVLERDILAAKEFGELKLLLPPGDIVLSSEPAVRKLRAGLKNFSDADYLLGMGDPISMMVAAAIAAEINDGVVNFLKWDRRRKSYYVVVVDLHNRLRSNLRAA